MASERLAVVILTWNNVRYTLECLQSLAAQAFPCTIYVVDNASTDGTPECVASRFPETHVIVNDDNLGFSGGNNVGLTAAFAAGAETVLLLNNDTTLAPDALAHLTEATHTHPQAGLLNPAILFAQPPHRIWFAGATLNPWTGWSYHTAYNTAYTALDPGIRETCRSTGCALLVTRDCYERIGGLDDSFFMYVEDVEYSMRAQQAGFPVLLVPKAVVYHHVSVSAVEKSPDTTYYGLRNTIITMDRLHPLPAIMQQMRHMLIVIGKIYYIAKPPSAFGRIGDIRDGYRDALRHYMGKRHVVRRSHISETVSLPSPVTAQIEEAI